MIRVENLPHCTFYMMRHGESEANKAIRAERLALLKKLLEDPAAEIPASKSFASKYDPLTATGRRQVGMARDGIFARATPRPTKVVSSEIDRAMESAELLTGNPMTPNVTDRRLNEWRKNADAAGEHQQHVLEALKDWLDAAEYNKDVPFFVAHHFSILRVLEAMKVQPDAIDNAAVYRFDPPKQEGGRWAVTRLTVAHGQLREEALEPTYSSLTGGELLRRFMKKKPDDQGRSGCQI